MQGKKVIMIIRWAESGKNVNTRTMTGDKEETAGL